MISTADAPSVIWDELPAVTLPPSMYAGFRFASVATLESGRIPSSVLMSSSVVAAVLVANVDGDDLALEASLGGRLGRAPVALGGEGVEVLAGDPPLVGDHLGTDALVLQSAHRLVASQDAWTEGEPRVLADRRTHGHPAHDLDAGGHDDVVRARHDSLGGEVQRLLGRATLAVDGGRGHRFGPARREHDVASDVEGLLAHLGDAAHDDVVDERRVEVVAARERAQRLGRQVDRVPVPQFPVALTPRGANGIHDDRSWHCLPFLHWWDVPTARSLDVRRDYRRKRERRQEEHGPLAR